MKIKKVEAVLLRIKHDRESLPGDFPIVADNLLVRIHTDAGIAGIGSAHIVPAYGETASEALLMVKSQYTALLLDSDPLDIELIMKKLDRSLEGSFFFYVAHLPSQAAIDIALHDIKGKALGVPVYQLLGGKVKDKVKLLAPQIQRAGAQAQAGEAKQWIDKGFNSIKVKVGGSNIEEDVERLRVVRQAVGDSVEIRVDANEYYDSLSAIKLINKIEPYSPEWVEDPVPSMSMSWDLEGFARVHRKVNVPIMAGQLGTATDMLRVINKDAVDCLKMKLVRGGGFLKSKKCIAIAEAAGMPLVTGNGADNHINFAAEMALNISSPHLYRACESAGIWTTPQKCQLVKEPLRAEGGYGYVSDKPGLGVELIDVETLEELANMISVSK
jgi:L-alanine-DL-glutamate epimerase-like enolase superfamily enzyme